MWTAGNELQAAQKFFKFLGCPSIFFKYAQSLSPGNQTLSLSLPAIRSLSPLLYRVEPTNEQTGKTYLKKWSVCARKHRIQFSLLKRRKHQRSLNIAPT
jgi:hypothetical protein